MKTQIILFALFISMICNCGSAKAQSLTQDLQQLALDYQKLSGLKSILKQMYTGYEIVTKGYNAVKDVAQGNFSLHKVFLDGLMVVSPTVRKYPRVVDIINDQASLMTEYKLGLHTFKQDKHFNPDEINSMIDIYNHLVSSSLQNLEELSMIMTDSQLRMSDAERIKNIDYLYSEGHSQLTFLRQFDANTQNLAVQRSLNETNMGTVQTLYGVN